MDKKEDSKPTWIMNEYGVKSCWPQNVAVKMVKTNYGWSFCAEDDVPETKQYPIGGGELTEAGYSRRVAASKKENPEAPAVEEEGEISYSDLKVEAKRLGIDRYWMKSKARLLKEIADRENVS